MIYEPSDPVGAAAALRAALDQAEADLERWRATHPLTHLSNFYQYVNLQNEIVHYRQALQPRQYVMTVVQPPYYMA